MSTAEGEHSLRKFLDPRLISMNLAATTRRQAVEELTGLLVRAGKVRDARAFVADVFRREHQMTATNLTQNLTQNLTKNFAPARPSLSRRGFLGGLASEIGRAHV